MAEVVIGASGAHFAVNALAVLSAVGALGADVVQASASLEKWSPVGGRGARDKITLPDGILELIDDSYNANPVSVGASLGVLAACEGRKIAVLGDMKELGDTGPDLHAGLAALDVSKEIDQFHTVGPLMAYLAEALPPEKRGLHKETSAEMAAAIPAELRAGDVVMVKGSLSMGLRQVVDAIRNMGQGD